MTAARPVVAHCNRAYFMGSETFIYHYLRHMERFRPICVSTAGPEIVNRDQFPFPSSDLYPAPIAGRASSSRLHAGVQWHTRAMLLRIPGLRDRVRRRDLDQDRLAGVLRSRDVKLVHAHFGPTGWDMLPASRALGVPLVTSFYGYDTAPEIKGEGPGWGDRRSELFEEGEMFLVEGPVMRDRLIALGCPAGKIRIQRIAIPLGRRGARPARDTGSPARVLFAGRFVEKKGLEYALEAVAALVRSGVALELRIIGDGPLMPRIRELVDSREIGEAVRLLGFVPHAELAREIEAADVFLHPSVTAANGDNEGGAPTVILEAQAMGVPVVATQHADIPNVTRAGESAILVPERDVRALADALRLVIERPGLRQQMGEAGRRHVAAFHDIRKEIVELERKYASLLGCGSTSSSSPMSGASNALVSVVMPTRNRAELLPRAIASVRAQTHERWELIVIDDCSSDATAEVLGRLASADPRIRVHRSAARGGGAAARNAGIGLAAGEYIAFLDDDDEWIPEKLTRQLAEFEADPSAAIVFSPVLVHAPDGSETLRGLPHDSSGPSWRALVRGNFISTSSAVVRGGLLRDAGGFDQRLPRLQDWELWLRLSRQASIRSTNEPTVRYYLTPDAISTDIAALTKAIDILLPEMLADPAFGRAERADLHWVFGHTYLAGGAAAEGRRHLRASLKLRPWPLSRVGVAVLSHAGARVYRELTLAHSWLRDRGLGRR